MADLLASVCRPWSYLLDGLTILLPGFCSFLKSSLATSSLFSYRTTARQNRTCVVNGIGAEAATGRSCRVSGLAGFHLAVVVTTKKYLYGLQTIKKKNYCMFALSNGHCDLPVATLCMSSLRGPGFEEQSRGNVPSLGREKVLENCGKHKTGLICRLNEACDMAAHCPLAKESQTATCNIRGRAVSSPHRRRCKSRDNEPGPKIFPQEGK